MHVLPHRPSRLALAIISGTVIHGTGKGRLLGFHTMNISPESVPPKISYGIYRGLVETSLGNFPAAIHYGPRPTMGDSVSFELHALGLTQKMYRRRIRVTLYKRIRGIRKFASVEALKKAITQDIAAVKKYFHPV